MRNLRVPYHSLTSEVDAELVAWLAREWPKSEQLGPMEGIKANTIIQIIRAYDIPPRAVIAVAGTPCQDVAGLNRNAKG
eukprot:14463984-Heterocapsa_arctica.AAC.1